MVERERRHGDFPAFFEGLADPDAHLLNVGDQIAVCEDRALRDAGRAARVLEERDVGVPDLVRGEAARGALRERFAEADRVRDRIGRHHLLHVLHDEVDERALEEGEEVAHGGRHDVAAVGVGQGAFEGLREVFDDDDRFGAGVLQRVVNFARRVERVDVHDDEARAQARVDGDDVLKEVRHHDGDAVAGFQPL